MRRLSLAILILAITAPNFAHADARVFGSALCRQTFPCPSSGNSNLTSSDLAAMGSQCIAVDIGLGATGDYFDSMAGLDSNNCLMPSSSHSSNGSSMQPKCCVVEAQNNMCQFQCQIISNK